MTTTIKLPTCDYPRCDGHLGKFDHCVTEALFYASLDSADETTGSTDAYGHYTLMIIPEPWLIIDAAEPNKPIMIPAGDYILETASSGAVYLDEHPTEESARARFADHEADYSEWSDANEPY